MGLFEENMPSKQAHFLSKVISFYHARLSRHVSFSSKGSCWAQLRGRMKTSVGAFLLSKGNFELLFSIEDGFALTGWKCSFLQVEDGQAFPKHHVLFTPPPAAELPARMPSAPPLLSSLLRRPCSPPALGTAVTGPKEMPEIPYNQSCLATAASEPPRGSAPSAPVLEVRVPVHQPAVSNLGVYMSETPLIALLTPIHFLTFGRALQICAGLEVMSDWLASLSGQLELGKAQKLLVWTKIPIPAAPQIGGNDLERGKTPLKMLILPPFHTLLDTQCTYSEFPFPLFPKPSGQLHAFQASSMRFSMTVDNTYRFLMGIFRKKKKILGWVKTG